MSIKFHSHNGKPDISAITKWLNSIYDDPRWSSDYSHEKLAFLTKEVFDTLAYNFFAKYENHGNSPNLNEDFNAHIKGHCLIGWDEYDDLAKAVESVTMDISKAIIEANNDITTLCHLISTAPSAILKTHYSISNHPNSEAKLAELQNRV